MSGHVLAASQIDVGVHPHVSFLGLTFNVDTVISTAIAALIVIGLGFFLRAKVTAGVPGGVQLFWEAITEFVRENVETRLNRRPAKFVIPLAITLFVFILIANWLSVLPSGRPEHLPPPTADTNLTYAMALLVIFGVHFAGFREKGPKRYLGHFLQPLPILLPITLVEEIAKPFSLALRLFGNIFAGTVMLAVIALFPPYLLWAPNVAWKLFDLFIGAIQAFIFALLTIIYFGQAAGEEGH